MADEDSGGQLHRWVGLATNVIAPATVLSTLLFYFGYVSSSAQYAYFGVDVDTIGLSTQDYVMRSPQPLLVPLLALTLLGIGAMVLHAWIRQRIAATEAGTRRPARLIAYRRMVGRLLLAGLVFIVAGVVLLFSYASLQDWAWFDLLTPLLLAVGASIVAYASRLQDLLRRPVPTNAPPGDDAATAARTHTDNSVRALRRSAMVMLAVVLVANIFWTTATVAQFSGRGQAHALAKRLDTLPSVILDTRERLYLRDPGVDETVLPAFPGQTFHYRYRHLRLLIHGHDRMFLVPGKWSASDSTLVVPLDETVRVQFQFENHAP